MALSLSTVKKLYVIFPCMQHIQHILDPLWILYLYDV